MGHYKSNLRDILFNLFEVLSRDEILGTGPYVDMDHDTAVAVLTEMDHLARTKLADSFAEVDRNLPIFDPSTSAVTLPEALKRTFSALMESGSWQLELPADSSVGSVGGQRTERGRESVGLPLFDRTEIRLCVMGERHRTRQEDR